MDMSNLVPVLDGHLPDRYQVVVVVFAGTT